MKLLSFIKNKIDFNDRDNLAVVILGGVLVLLSAVVFYSEALTPEPSAGRMNLFGFEVALSLDRKSFNSVLAVAAAIGALVTIISAFIKVSSERLRTALFWLLIALVFACSTAVTLKYGFIRHFYHDFGDAYSYFLGPKYFKELGYDVHYECTAAAQLEDGARPPRRGRDLRSNRMRPLEELASPDRREACRERFSDERWQSFKKDVATFRSWHGREGWQRRFRDHGYNGTPVYQAIAGFLSNAVDLNHRNMVLLALLNLWMVFLMFGVVIKAFGWRFGLLFALLFWSNFLERWLLGGAYLRYMWISAIIIGLSCIKLNRYHIAGGLFAFAAGIKIFPVLLFLGIGIVILWNLVEKKGILPEHKRFIKGAVVTGVALAIISLVHGHGFSNWSEFLHQMGLNSGRYSTMRVGFIYNFIWPKELLPTDPMRSYIARVEAMKEPFFLFLSLHHIRWILTGVVFYFIIKNIRKMDDITRTALVAFTTFFMLLGTVRYYYSGFLGLPLMWHASIHEKSGKLFFGYLLAVSALAYLIQHLTAYPFPYNTYYPLALTVYLVAFVLYLEIPKRNELID